MRTCRRCKVEKNDDQFGKLKCSKDGINPRCRQCCCESVKRANKSPSAIAKKKIYVSEWQKQNREKRLEQSRNWYRRNLDKAREMSLDATKKYFSTEKGKKNRTTRGSKWEKENPEKRRVHDRTMYAVKTGKLARPNNCSKCGCECKPQAHHEDYSKPYEVIWLCAQCHFYHHHKSKHHAERTSEKTPKGDAMFRPLEETQRDIQK
jgi:hypothetical protein